ncbi:MAG: hypothetical protein R3Y68_02150 [Rikenellaceae bacterium]
MNILMIGNKDSGKTTYMTSAYGSMQSLSDSFSIHTDSISHKLFVEQYNSMRGNGVYPPATLRRNSFDFHLKYNGNTVHNFTWNDFNGGVISERSTENEKLLVHDIHCSDGLMLFFDAQQLKNNSIATKVREIIRLLAKNLKSIERPYYISIVITKSDLIGLRYNDELETVLQPLKPMLNIINANEYIQSIVTPVCCIKNKIINADFPILYMLHGGMMNYISKESDRLDNELKLYQNFVESAGTFDDIKSFFCNEPTYREIAKKKAQEIQPQIDYYNSMLETLKTLVNRLSNRDLYKEFRNINNNYYL